jgi:hypothetical protein
MSAHLESHTTRFLFPFGSNPQQAVHTIFETKNQQGTGFKEKIRPARLPPLKAGARGELVATAHDATASSNLPTALACYKHYDVQLDWCEVRHATTQCVCVSYCHLQYHAH